MFPGAFAGAFGHVDMVSPYTQESYVLSILCVSCSSSGPVALFACRDNEDAD